MTTNDLKPGARAVVSISKTMTIGDIPVEERARVLATIFTRHETGAPWRNGTEGTILAKPDAVEADPDFAGVANFLPDGVEASDGFGYPVAEYLLAVID